MADLPILRHRLTHATVPSGTVTFLITDIEGSTDRWERHPDAMRAALQRHDVLMREVVEAHAGDVFKTVGDAFCAAFASAGSGLAAAVDAQRFIDAEDRSRFGEGFLPIRGRRVACTGVRAGQYLLRARLVDYGGTHYHRERGADPKPQSDGAQPIMIDYQRHFTTDPEICGGQTVVAGTRVTLRTVLATLAEGASIEEVLVEFPTLSREAVRAVIAFAAAAAEDDLPVPAVPSVP